MNRTIALFVFLLLPLYFFVAQAQSSVAEVLEKARAEARVHNEYKAALNDPDPAVRLAVFNEMLKQDNVALHKVALETGLTSTDSVMRSLALKSAVLDLAQLHVQLTVDPDSSQRQQEAAKKHLEDRGGTMTLRVQKKDIDQGIISADGWEGQISSLQLLLKAYNSNSRAVLVLQDNNSLKGTLYLGATPFIAQVDLL